MGLSEGTLSVIRAYHQGWTEKDFKTAGDCLSPGLKVEVPVNNYPTKESFAQAVAAFGSMTEKVVLLAEFANAEEGMLLYDMTVKSLGILRVAEHFTVQDGKIVRIRQIHDTAALRQAGFVH